MFSKVIPKCKNYTTSSSRMKICLLECYIVSLNKYSQFLTFRHNLTSQRTETLSNTVIRTLNIIRGKIILNYELENMLKKYL